MRRAFQLITFLFCSVVVMEQDVFADTPVFPPAQDLTLTAPEAVLAGDQPGQDAGAVYSAMGQSCETVLNAQPGDAGMIRVDLQIPCLGGQRVDLFWSGFAASYLTSVTGALQVDLPVFEREVHVQMRLSDGAEQHVQVTHEVATEFTGAGLSWRGGADVALHVLENGADFNTAGHRSPDRPVGIAGGRMVVLGDPGIADGFISQIYTTAKARGSRVSRMFAEVQVTEGNCGGTQMVTLHQPAIDGSLRAMPFEISVPACEKAGQSVMLGSPLRDLVLAEEQDADPFRTTLAEHHVPGLGAWGCTGLRAGCGADLCGWIVDGGRAFTGF